MHMRKNGILLRPWLKSGPFRSSEILGDDEFAQFLRAPKLAGRADILDGPWCLRLDGRGGLEIVPDPRRHIIFPPKLLLLKH